MSRTFAVGFLGLAVTSAVVWDRCVRLPAVGRQAMSDENDVGDETPGELPAATFSSHAAPFLTKHCVGCHAGDQPKGGLSLTFPDEAAATAGRKPWPLVAEVVRSGRMPPPGRLLPDPAQSMAFLAWADAAAASGQPPRRVTARRHNRAEYDHTIRALLGVDVRPAADFPADDTGDGFDTLGDVLSVSPTLTEKYLAAAEATIAAAAADPVAWAKLRTPPASDPVPYALRGAPPERGDANKGTADGVTGDDAGRATDIDRTYYALQTFADRAYRRPVSHREMYRLMRFVETALDQGEPADAGLRLAFTAVLVSPHFLFRLEPDGGPAGRRLTGFEVAARVSYFLWAGPPDDELVRLACADKLGDPRVLAGQVRRMLADPRSRSLAEQFAGQWLGLRGLADIPLDADLRAAMRTETEQVFDDVVRADRSVLDLLTGEETFVNERLARHYCLAGVTGEGFRRVSLAGTGRGGVLTHASVLAVTSGPTRTSPVKRGKWVLDNLLGTPAPPPPPGVDSLTDDTGPSASTRERFAQHRTRAECASCHARLDPLGFGLENFDAVGRWRDRDGGAPVDASGVLPDGRSFTGPAELRSVLAARPDDFVRCLTRKLFTYALGRSPTPADGPAIERVVRQAARCENRFADLAVALVRSEPFQIQPALPPGGSP